MDKKAFRFTVLGLAGAGLLVACAETQDGPAAGGNDDRPIDGARMTAAETGQALMTNAKAAPAALVRDFLTARGAGRAAGELKVTGAARGRGLTHLRLEQEVGGLRVHGAYVKAAVTHLGELVHVVDRLAASDRRVAPAGSARRRRWTPRSSTSATGPARAARCSTTSRASSASPTSTTPARCARVSSS